MLDFLNRMIPSWGCHGYWNWKDIGERDRNSCQVRQMQQCKKCGRRRYYSILLGEWTEYFYEPDDEHLTRLKQEVENLNVRR